MTTTLLNRIACVVISLGFFCVSLTSNAEVIEEGSQSVSTTMEYVKNTAEVICVITLDQIGEVDSVKLSYESDSQAQINQLQTTGYTAIKLPPTEKCTANSSTNTIPTITVTGSQDAGEMIMSSSVDYKEIELVLFNYEKYVLELNKNMKQKVQDIFENNLPQS